MNGVIITALAVYAIGVLTSEYDGPLNVLQRLREKFTVFQCLTCSAVWVNVPLSFFMGLGVPEYLAVIGLVLLADRITA